MITSIGYRVKSSRGIQFRQWANSILKEYILRGHTINQRLIALEDRVDRKLSVQDKEIQNLKRNVDFLTTSSTLPKEGVFYNGQIFDAYILVSTLIKSAQNRIAIIDNYVDDSVLIQLTKRKPGVIVDIYDGNISKRLNQDVDRHNAQYPGVRLHNYTKAHDRFIVIDETVYHIGASLKDLGKKLFAFSKMECLTGSQLLSNL